MNPDEVYIFNEFEKWTAHYRTAMGWQLQYEERYDFGLAAFKAGYELAKLEIKSEMDKTNGK